ncbi:MAG: HAD family hydrolase [Candidatus Obscuribacterales bacterium]|nr:HAD family hydrolase [Candidatus Obscuribacterales bacterium]
MSSKKASIFVDLNETLIRGSYLEEGQTPPAGSVPFSLVVDGETRQLALQVRPSAQAFLESLSQTYNLYAFNYSNVEVQDLLLKAVGLKKFFQKIYSPFDPGQIAIDGPWVLVDNWVAWAQGLEKKFMRFGIDAEKLKVQNREDLPSGADGMIDCGPRWQAVIDLHYIRCLPYIGLEDPEPLTTLLPEINRRLALQS